ncbi:MAG: sulfurtransferase TusA family protein [Firmicutes bacterium]|nr:sulfurtransferase TusA family protein [Bacillota bacterium]
MATIDIGAVIEVWTTDPGALADFPAWTELTGHHLLATRQEGDIYIFQIRRMK